MATCYEVSVMDDKIVCKSHHHETCKECNVDWTDQNDLAESIKPIDHLPPPNVPITIIHQHVNHFKQAGNTAFKEKNYTESIEQYSTAAEIAWSRPLWEPLAFQSVREELAPILSNRSAAQVILGNYIEGLVDAEIVTRLKKDWSKGWFRKGKALFGLERYQESIKAYRTGLLFENNSQDLIVALKEAENAVANH